MTLADVEAETYAKEIARAIVASGIQVSFGGGNVIIPPPIGVIIRGDRNGELAKVFSAVGIVVGTNPAPAPTPLITVGVKPPHF
jgi:hypothetical protein